ncbi:hypothetical protein C0J52_16454 [Blattella germanica]|nr:hypothetical protein C0J52_16454 [Blattella germanica]
MSDMVSMAPQIISMGVEVIMNCMSENNMSIMKTGASLMTARTIDQNAKCTVCCITSQIMITDGDKCSVNTAMIDTMVGALPKAVQDIVKKITKGCTNAGAGKSKCQGLFDYGACIFKEGKNNIGSIFKMG